jgi:ASCH domain
VGARRSVESGVGGPERLPTRSARLDGYADRVPGPGFRGVGDSRDRGRYVTPVRDVDPLAVAAFWERALDAVGLDPATPAPAASCFGDMVELADELIDLVLAGTKRATASSVEHLEADGEPVPQVGGLWIATDGSMRPRALLETTDVRIGPLSGRG